MLWQVFHGTQGRVSDSQKWVKIRKNGDKRDGKIKILTRVKERSHFVVVIGRREDDRWRMMMMGQAVEVGHSRLPKKAATTQRRTRLWESRDAALLTKVAKATNGTAEMAGSKLDWRVAPVTVRTIGP